MVRIPSGLGCPDDAAGDLAAIGDQNALEHGLSLGSRHTALSLQLEQKLIALSRTKILQSPRLRSALRERDLTASPSPSAPTSRSVLRDGLMPSSARKSRPPELAVRASTLRANALRTTCGLRLCQEFFTLALLANIRNCRKFPWTTGRLLPFARGRMASVAIWALPAGGQPLDCGAIRVEMASGGGVLRPRLSGGRGLYGPRQLGDLPRGWVEIRLRPAVRGADLQHHGDYPSGALRTACGWYADGIWRRPAATPIRGPSPGCCGRWPNSPSAPPISPR